MTLLCTNGARCTLHPPIQRTSRAIPQAAHTSARTAPPRLTMHLFSSIHPSRRECCDHVPSLVRAHPRPTFPFVRVYRRTTRGDVHPSLLFFGGSRGGCFQDAS